MYSRCSCNVTIRYVQTVTHEQQVLFFGANAVTPISSSLHICPCMFVIAYLSLDIYHCILAVFI